MENTIRVTLSQVRGEIRDDRKAASLLAACKAKALLVIGYSGYDADISQILRQAGREGGAIFWLTRSQPRPGEPSATILAEFGARGQMMVGSIAELFAALAVPLALGFSVPPEDAAASETLRRRAEGLVPILERLPTQNRLLALGALLQALGQYEAALQVYDRGSVAAKAGNDGPMFATSLGARYYLLRDWGKVQEAGSTLKLIQELRTASGDVFPLAPYMRPAVGAGGAGFSKSRSSSGQHPPATNGGRRGSGSESRPQRRRAPVAARETRRSGRVICTLTGNQRRKSKTWRWSYGRATAAGILEIEKGNIAEAKRVFEELRDDAHQTGKPQLEQAALYELGLIAANHTHEYLKARRCFTDALRMAEELRLGQQAVRCLTGLGDTDYEEGIEIENRGLIESAERTFGEAIEAARRAEDEFTHAFAYLRRVRCRAVLGRRLHSDAGPERGLRNREAAGV